MTKRIDLVSLALLGCAHIACDGAKPASTKPKSLEVQSNVARLREFLTLPSHVGACRYVSGAVGMDPSETFAPGPTDLWADIYCGMNEQAWQELGLPGALELTTSPLTLRSDVADAILSQSVVPPHSANERWVSVPAARVGAQLSGHWSRGSWRVSDGYVVGDGLLIRMIAE
jgi:hypothetical protein